MAITQTRSKRKSTGGRYKATLTKRLHSLARAPRLTKLDETKRKKLRVRGANEKIILFSSNTANVYNPKTKKYQKTKIKNISENTANRNFVKRNIMNKGAIIETELGKAKITSRPGQEGTINAVLI